MFLAFYIYAAIALMTIAKKTKTKNKWLAFIPLANVYLVTQIAKKPGWQALLILLGFIPWVGGVITAILLGYWFYFIALRMKKEGWLGILMAIPIVNLVIIGILAWSN